MGVIIVVAEFDLGSSLNFHVDFSGRRAVVVAVPGLGLSSLGFSGAGGIGLAGSGVGVDGDAGGERSDGNAAATVMVWSGRVERHADLLLSASMVASGEGGGGNTGDGDAGGNDGGELSGDHDHFCVKISRVVEVFVKESKRSWKKGVNEADRPGGIRSELEVKLKD